MIAMYAYPPDLQIYLDESAERLSENITYSQLLKASDFPKGICVSLVTSPEESKKPYSYKISKERIFCSMKVNGDELWEIAAQDGLRNEAERILRKVVLETCKKYRIEVRSDALG